MMMFGRKKPLRKRTPTDHQRRIRFLTGLSIVLVILATIGLFVLINLSQYRVH